MLIDEIEKNIQSQKKIKNIKQQSKDHLKKYKTMDNFGSNGWIEKKIQFYRRVKKKKPPKK